MNNKIIIKYAIKLEKMFFLSDEVRQGNIFFYYCRSQMALKSFKFCHKSLLNIIRIINDTMREGNKK